MDIKFINNIIFKNKIIVTKYFVLIHFQEIFIYFYLFKGITLLMFHLGWHINNSV